MSSNWSPVGLLVGHAHDRAARLRQGDDALGQVVDGDLLVTAEVEDPPHRCRLGKQPHQRIDHIAHVAKAARLRAVPINLQRLPLHRRRHEARQHHAVLPHLPRADRIEQPDDRHRQAELLVVCQAEEFVDPLAVGVAAPAGARRPHDDVIVLGERHPRALAINLRGAGDQHRPAEPVGGFEDDFGAMDSRADRPHRLVHDQLHANRRRQVKHRVARRHQQVDGRFVLDRVADDLQPVVSLDGLEVLLASGGEVVQDDNGVPVCEQPLGQV